MVEASAQTEWGYNRVLCPTASASGFDEPDPYVIIGPIGAGFTCNGFDWNQVRRYQALAVIPSIQTKPQIKSEVQL